MKSLRKNIRRVGLLLCALFALLVLYGAYSLSNYGSRWFSVNANTWLRSAKRDVIPGDIYDINGILLAGSTVTDDAEGGFTAVRRYAADADTRRAVVHCLGDAAGNVSNGVESFMAKALYGFDQSIFERLNDFATGTRRKGDTLTLTVDSALCRYILSCVESLRAPGRSTAPRGAVVVMNWKTGAVLAGMSFPAFDPERPRGEGYFNRAVQGLYAPGSTFKIVTAAAVLGDPALNGRSFSCTGRLEAADGGGLTRSITDAGTDSAQGVTVAHGQIDLKRAFVMSCNNTFASAALMLGDESLRRQAMAFGYDENFLFHDLVVENSAYPDEDRSDWELAMTGIGQSALTTTPLHLCLVAAAIANDGVMPEPKLIAQATASNGRVRRRLSPEAARTVFKDPAQAAILRDYMFDAVNTEAGTGHAAALNGWRVCGKTGSAEVDGQANTNALFVGFLDDEEAPYALSIVLEDMGSGGEYAAPLAHDIFEYLTSLQIPRKML